MAPGQLDQMKSQVVPSERSVRPLSNTAPILGDSKDGHEVETSVGGVVAVAVGGTSVGGVVGAAV